MQLEAFLDLLEGVTQQFGTDRWMARCPAHADDKQSLSIKDADDKVLLCCHAGCKTKDILAVMDLHWGDLWYEDTTSWKARGERMVRSLEREDEYMYTDEHGTLLYKVVRYAGKRFKHERRFVPYRLPELVRRLPSEPVYVVEGEKDVHALERFGKLATCNAGGVGSWKDDFAAYFEGAQVIVWADKDEPGMKHASEVAASLQGVARSVVLVQSRAGKDAADHLDAGYSPEDYVVVSEVLV